MSLSETTAGKHPALPYVAPMLGFLLLTAAEGYLPSTGGRANAFWYPLAYAVKVVVVAGLVWACRSTWRDLDPRPSPGVLALAAALGLFVAAIWVRLDGHYRTFAFLGTRSAFDPNLLPRSAKWGFVTIRFLGLVALVPLIEELFWRSFLMRWIIDPDFQKVPIGRVTPLAAAVTSIMFGFVHPEWLPGILTGLAWAGLLWQTRSVAACLVSHATANLALGLYVIATENWKFW